MNNIKINRVLSGYSQREMAGKLGISLSSYGLKENKKRRFKDDEMLAFRDIVKEREPSITIDDIFFT